MRQIALITLALLAVGSHGMAQGGTGWIVVNDPGEWSDGQTLTVPARARVVVIGQAYHPQGITKVTVAGVAATLKRDPLGVVDFEATISARDAAQITVVASSPGGESVTKSFPLAIDNNAIAPATTGQATQYDPRTAARRSIVPGLGQFYTGQETLGFVFMGATVAALGVGIGVREIKVRCFAPLVNGKCPAGQEAGNDTTRPFLIPGLVAAVGLGVLSSRQASSYAKKKSAARGDASGMNGPTLGIASDRGAVGFTLEWRFGLD